MIDDIHHRRIQDGVRRRQARRSSRPIFRRGSTGCAGGRFHTLVVVALGITWILDGLEVTLAGAVSPALEGEPAAAFLQRRRRAREQRLSCRRGAGRAVLRLAHRPARAQAAVLHHARGLSRRHRGDRAVVDLWSFALFRFFTGAGIGGEYTAINSTIQELVPARYRGWTDLVINGSFWIGAALGAAGSIVLLDPARAARRISDGAWRFSSALRSASSIFLMRLVAAGIAALADDAWPRRRRRSACSLASRPSSALAGIVSPIRTAAGHRGCARAASPRSPRSPTRCFASSAGARWSV